MQQQQKKCTKKRDARANYLFCLINLLLNVLFAVAVVVPKTPLLFSTKAASQGQEEYFWYPPGIEIKRGIRKKRYISWWDTGFGAGSVIGKENETGIEMTDARDTGYPKPPGAPLLDPDIWFIQLHYYAKWNTSAANETTYPHTRQKN